MSEHELYMTRCLQLALQAQGETAPNPMVGSVVVHNGQIVGEGYHRKYGEAHAEVNAIASVKDQTVLKESTLFVNLEPCSHYGKTPPCAKLIIEKKIPRVVIGMSDPNPLVNGKGIRLLREAGVEVVEPVLLDACLDLNKRFVTMQTKHRPYIILKWAQTADGFLDRFRDDASVPPLRISTDITKALNHQIRSIESSILVATNTALLDNPHLTSYKWGSKNPVRLMVDRSLRVPASYKIYDQLARTIIFTDRKEGNDRNLTFAMLDFSKNIVPQILDYLYLAQINSVIVEGGSQLLNSFIEAYLWDEAYVEVSPICIHTGVAAPSINMRVTETRHYEQHVVNIGVPA